MSNTVKADGASAPENPFQTKDGMSDVALVVEGKNLHVHKTLLALHSPVFQAMFFSDFREKEASEIELPGKNYEDFVEFLLHLYPDHCMRTIDDDRLCAVLPLAEEYQVQRVRRKCRDYIQVRLKSVTPYSSSLTVDQLLLYLWMSDQGHFHEEKKKALACLVGYIPKSIAASKYYNRLDARIMRDFMYTKTTEKPWIVSYCKICQSIDNRSTKLQENEYTIKKLQKNEKQAREEIALLRHKLQFMHEVTLHNCMWSSAYRFPLKTFMFWLTVCIVLLLVLYVCWTAVSIPKI